MSDYAKFRAWIAAKIAEGANPAQVSKWLYQYRVKFLDTAPKSWADGSEEVPTLEEIEKLASKTDW